MSESMRYISHHNLEGFGKDGQKKLSNSSILIIGVGGLGSATSLYLTVSGIGKLTLVDFDSVDESNLSRQILFQKKDIGILVIFYIPISNTFIVIIFTHGFLTEIMLFLIEKIFCLSTFTLHLVNLRLMSFMLMLQL